MTIIREEHRNNFTVFDNRVLQDRRLSLTARGLLEYILSMPTNWSFTIDDLVAASKPDDRSTVEAALNELKEVGYVADRENQEMAR